MPYPTNPDSLGIIRQRELNIHVSSINNSAPAVADFVNANMKAYQFSGAAQTDRLYGFADLQHDYADGTDLILHIHWAPATATGGNVKWQFYVQWVEVGETWSAPVLYSVTTAAGTTAWADKVSGITIPGAGHTYNSRLRVQFFRDPTDAADTYTGGASITALGCHYQSKMANEG